MVTPSSTGLNGDQNRMLEQITLIGPANVTEHHIRALAMRPSRDHPDFSDYVDALEEYVQALKARDRAVTALAKADRILQERLAELEAICDRVAGE
jgi:hypothetical protein